MSHYFVTIPGRITGNVDGEAFIALSSDDQDPSFMALLEEYVTEQEVDFVNFIPKDHDTWPAFKALLHSTVFSKGEVVSIAKLYGADALAMHVKM